MSLDDAKTPPEGIHRIIHGLKETEAGIEETAKQTGRQYKGFVAKAGNGVSSAVSACTSRLDAAVGDTPWRAIGLGDRNTRVARKVLTRIVPATAGERASSFLDGVAIKAGAGGAGILLRIPLKPVVVPILAAMAAIETVKVVKDLRQGIRDVADEVDRELDAEVDPLA